MTNLLYLDLECHRDIHRDESYAAFKGWMSGPHHDLTPVWVWRARWGVLTADGGIQSLTAQHAEEVLRWLEEVA